MPTVRPSVSPDSTHVSGRSLGVKIRQPPWLEVSLPVTGAGSSLPCSVLAEGCGDAEVLDSVEEDGADVAALDD